MQRKKQDYCSLDQEGSMEERQGSNKVQECLDVIAVLPPTNPASSVTTENPIPKSLETDTSGMKVEKEVECAGRKIPTSSSCDQSGSSPQKHGKKILVSGSVTQASTCGQSGSDKTRKEGTKLKRKREGKEFLDDEAKVVGDCSATTTEDSDSSDHSFEERGPTLAVTETEHVRYLESIKKIPERKFRDRTLCEVARSVIEMDKLNPNSRDVYDKDMKAWVAADDVVEPLTRGDFEKSMEKARIAVEAEGPSARFKRTLRSHTQNSREEKLKLKRSKPKRKRIIVESSSDDSD